MKKFSIFLVSLLILTVLGITFISNQKRLSKDNQQLQVETYVDGKLVAVLPSSDEGYKVSSISCTNGATATFNYSTWRIEATNITNNTSCTIRFVSNDNTNFNTYLKSKVCSSTPTSDAAAKDCLVNENGYRYEGSNPNNYVLFNNELWRIIGVFNVQNSSGKSEDLVKLIRNDILDVLAWNGANSNDWSNATLQQQLNSGYLNASDITCNSYSTTITKTCTFSQNGINSIARNQIESVVWKLGGLNTSSAEQEYTSEQSSTVYSGNSTTWTGKVALMYPSDYGYASLASSCPRNTNLGSYSNSGCATNNWLFKSISLWTLTHSSSGSSLVSCVFDTGEVITNYLYDVGEGASIRATDGLSVLPSIYLKSNIRYISGNGTRSNPYQIS